MRKPRRSGRGRAIRWRSAVLFVAVLVGAPLLLVTPSDQVGSSTPDAPPGDPSVGTTGFHQLIMMQGDDPTTEELEDKGVIAVVYRSFWTVPMDSDRVYVSVPSGAMTVSLDNVRAVPHQGITYFSAGPYSSSQNPDDPPETGWETGGDYTGFYYWSFPEGADRLLHNSLTFTAYDDFNDTDEDLTARDDWAIDDGNLSLAANVTSASYVSKVYTDTTDIGRINVTYSAIDPGDNMTLLVTKDNGTSWHQVVNGTELSLPGEGREFRWRVDMVQNASANNTPVLAEVSFAFVLVPEQTELWLQATYLIDIPRGGLELELLMPFDGNQSGMIFLGYFDVDMELVVTGTEVTATPGATYASKVTHMHMVGGYSPSLTFSVKEVEGDGEDNGGGGDLILWLIAAMLIIAALAISARSWMAPSASDERGPEEDGADGDGDEDDESKDALKQLELEKEALMGRINRLDERLEAGEMDEEAHRTKRAELKAQAIGVMRRIDDRK